MSLPTRKQVLGAGLALVIAPPIAILVKGAVYPGWMLLIIFFSGIPLLLGYALQIVIASNGMLRERGVFNTAAGSRRGVAAAWLTSAGVLLAAFFLVDGGDDGTYGSAFTMLLGNSSTPAGEQLSGAFLLLAALLWLGGWLWLVVEWVVLLVRARRAAGR